MSKKVPTIPGESAGGVDWINLPPELVALISSFLEEGIDVTRFRSVCRLWRSSRRRIPNKISPLFPQKLPSSLHPFDDLCESVPHKLIANSIYLLKNKSSAFLLSLQEYSAGNLILLHPLTSRPIISPSIDVLDSLASEWTISRLAISHSFYFAPIPNQCNCPICTQISDTNLHFVPNVGPSSEAVALFRHSQSVYAIRHCLSSTDADIDFIADCRIDDFVNFNGLNFAIGIDACVYLVLQFVLHRLEYTCVPLVHTEKNKKKGRKTDISFPLSARTRFGKRLVVSNGDLYVVFNECILECCVFIYKVVLDDIHRPKCYTLKRVYNLNDRVFFINRDCSFSVFLPFPSVVNRVFVGESAFPSCSCLTQDNFGVYKAGGNGKIFGHYKTGVQPPGSGASNYSSLFEPPAMWRQKLYLDQAIHFREMELDVYLEEKREEEEGAMENNPPISAVGNGDDMNPVLLDG